MITELTVFVKDGQNVTDSRNVATIIEKRHDNLIRDIRRYIEYLASLENEESDRINVSECFIEIFKGGHQNVRTIQN